VLAIDTYQARQERVVEVREQALRQGKFALLELERILNGVQNVLLTASAANEARERQPQVCSQLKLCPYVRSVVGDQKLLIGG
jgi:hypothetical protein